MHAVIFCGMHRKPAPAGADFNHPVTGLQFEHPANPIVFGLRCLFQGALFVLEDAAGIGHGIVEEQTIKIISKVIMSQDVFATSHLRIFPGEMIKFVKRCREAGKALLHVFKGFLINGQYSHNHGQIICRPQSLHICFSCANAAAEKNSAIELRMMHGNIGF